MKMCNRHSDLNGDIALRYLSFYMQIHMLYGNSSGVVYLAEEIELLVQWGADLHQSNWAGLRLVGAYSSDPDVAQISNIQGPIRGHGYRRRGFKTSVTGVTSIS